MRTLLIFAILLLAGCTSNADVQSGDEPQTDNAAQDTNGTEPTVLTGSAVASGAGTPVVSFSQGGAVSFVVPEGTSLLFAEVKWDSDVFDVDLYMQTSDNLGSTTWDYSHQAGSPGSPDNPHFIEVANPMSGDWAATVFANGAAANVNVDFAFTLFAGETSVPEGYTAF